MRHAGRSPERGAKDLGRAALAARAFAAALAGAALLAGCGTPGAAPRAEEAWVSPLGRDHPLAGRIYDLVNGREIGEAELLAGLAQARFVLLGESHENADHHRLQALVIRELAARGAEAAVAFEMLSADQQPALDALRASETPSAEALRQATKWDEGGWPDFALYAPVFEAALAARLPLVAADLSAADRKLLASADPVPFELRARLGLDEPLPDALQQALERDLMASHCHRLPAHVLPRLVRVQRGRDAALAGAVAGAAARTQEAGATGAREDAAGAQEDAARAHDLGLGGREAAGGTVVLLAGAEHVRRDRGAPRTLARLAPGAEIRSLAFLEVRPEHRDAGSDLRARYGSTGVFDYVWYTPRASDEDYCERIPR